MPPLSFGDIEKAGAVLHGVVKHTALVPSKTFSALADAQLYLKL
jgi:threonine dehydratase